MFAIFMFTAVVLFQPESPVDQARALISEGNYLMAEATLLSEEPSPEDMVARAELLATIALRLGDKDGKERFFSSQLSESAGRRAVALMVLSILNVAQEDWEGFDQYGKTTWMELGPLMRGQDLAWRLLYHLARHTTVSPESLKLNPAESRWFLACRGAAMDRIFPIVDGRDLPYRYHHAWILDNDDISAVPRDPVGDNRRDQYFHQLLKIKVALNTGELNDAAAAVNETFPFDEDPKLLDVRLHFLPLVIQFFQARNLEARAATIQRNLEISRNWALMPIFVDPARVLVVNETLAEPVPEEVPEQPEEEKIVPVETESSEPAPLDPAGVSIGKAEGADQKLFAALEARVLEGDKSAAAEVEEAVADTAYKRIYKNYLVGLVHLGRGWFRTAYERLQAAESLVGQYPFPNLESKIFLALGRYYQAQENPRQAEWYYIAAVQNWARSENVPIMAFDGHPVVDPHEILLDQALADAASRESIHESLLYSEQMRFVTLRRDAFLGNRVSTNPILGRQLKEVALDLHGFVSQLADDPSYSASPRRYNQTLEIWNQLWLQTLPLFREVPDLPSLDLVQANLQRGDRLLVFIEGRRSLGLLVVNSGQAFLVALGEKEAFEKMGAEAAIAHLEARLGPVWEREGNLILVPGEVVLRSGVVHGLSRKLEKELNIQPSVRAWLAPVEPSVCRTAAIVKTDHTAAEPVFAPDTPALAVTRAVNPEPAAFWELLEDRDILIYSGEATFNSEGELLLGEEGRQIKLSELIHYNDRLCTIAFITNDLTFDHQLLQTLSLLYSRVGLVVLIADSAEKMENYLGSRPRAGIYLL